MNLSHIRPVAQTIHHLNDDYNLRVPRIFTQLGIAGVGVMLVNSIGKLVSPTISLIPAVFGLLLALPAGISYIGTRSALHFRYHLRDRIVRYAALQGDEQVLDVGVGSGITLFGFAKHLPTGKGIGIDIYHPHAGGGTPEIFWRNARQEGVTERVELKNMDARQMSFTDESFDVIVSTFAFHHIGNEESRRKAAQEIVRVLKPGGKVLVYDASLALNELEAVMREKGFKVQREGRYFSMVIGQK